ncbi:MAG: alpha/beta hydrolase [Myxococcota bacterium]
MAAATLEGDVPVTAGHRLGRLASRVHAPRHQGSPGRVALGVTAERDTLAIVPPTYRPDHPAPLLVVLHGAGGDGRSALGLLEHVADRTGAIVLAPSSRDRTWDIIVGHVGSDVALLDRSLAETFDRWVVDPAHVVLAGFSDGASYALTIGLANGSLFRNVLALSPGFCAPPSHDGRPRVFVSHGVNDTVLPIRTCSRRLVPQLRTQGYDVTYVEFQDGHVVPPDVIDRALGWLGLPEKRSR